MVTVTAAELQKQFEHYRDMASKQPISITHQGRESLIVLSIEEYQRLKALDDRQALYPWELPEDVLQALENIEVPEESGQFNHEYK